MSVNNIVDKILNDARKAELGMLEKAEIEAEKIKDAKEKEIASFIENNKIKAEREGISKKERLIQNAHLQVRNNKLKAKQEIIKNVFDKSIDKLNNLSDEEFIAFVKNTLKNTSFDGTGVIILNNKRHKLITPKMVHKINKNLVISDPDDSMGDGFMVKVENVYYNFTFKAIVEGLKSELTSEVVKILF